MPRPSPIIFVLLTAIALTGKAAPAQEPPAGPTTPVPAAAPDAFGERVRAYLLAHPEVIVEAVQIYQQRQEAAQAETAKGMIVARADEIFRDPAAPSAGNAAGDVTLVEFFDYNCRYCRAVAPTVGEILGADRGLRLVYKEFPILGPGSEAAARVALAARQQGRYQEVHEALMTAEPPVTEEKALQVAAAAGLDPEQLRRDMADPAVDQAIARNRSLAVALGINGTPAFVVADRVVPGAVDRATLERLIAKARGKSKAAP